MLNMLIFVAEPVNHEVKNKPTIFNIIYIIRTKIRAINFWALMALGSVHCDALYTCSPLNQH